LRKQTYCRACGGTGTQKINGNDETCPRCKGSKTVIPGKKKVKCLSCGGSGAVYGHSGKCNACRGTGWVDDYN